MLEISDVIKEQLDRNIENPETARQIEKLILMDVKKGHGEIGGFLTENESGLFEFEEVPSENDRYVKNLDNLVELDEKMYQLTVKYNGVSAFLKNATPWERQRLESLKRKFYHHIAVLIKAVTGEDNPIDTNVWRRLAGLKSVVESGRKINHETMEQVIKQYKKDFLNSSHDMPASAWKKNENGFYFHLHTRLNGARYSKFSLYDIHYSPEERIYLISYSADSFFMGVAENRRTYYTGKRMFTEEAHKQIGVQNFIHSLMG